MTTENLWGEIEFGVGVPVPVTILEKQASKLEEITGGWLLARVLRSQTGFEFYATLEIRAPYLNNYRLEIVDVRYPPTIYPVEVYDLISNPGIPRTSPTFCENDDQFVSQLGSILGSPKLHRTISILIAHSQSERSDVQPGVTTSR